MNREKSQQSSLSRPWFRSLWQWQGSVIPSIVPRVFGCAFFALGISVLYYFGLNVALPLESGLVPSIVLGLLLVFRTNTAYERYWEGRKLWGLLINTVRNLSRTIWVTIKENDSGDRTEKIVTLRLLIAFAIATKLHLRSEPVNEDLARFLPEKWHKKLCTINHPPLEIAFLIGDYLQQQYNKGSINSYQLTAMFKLLDTMVDVLGACERILKTPIPLAYTIHLKQLVLLYCLTLPFQFVDELGWMTAPIVALISFTILGIEAIGIEIEDPFGYDANDL
ncbi:MAG: bestrophin family ion channel, partial [Crocosphaera sp.]|nr:bestrophin family ion channel [Crocosphaera sp.]